MTKDDIVRMAVNSGMELYGLGKDREKFIHCLNEFAALVAAAERWEIKKDIEEEMTDELDDQAYHLCMELIAKILKRGTP